MNKDFQVCKGRLLLVPAPLDFGVEHSVPLTNMLPTHTLQQAAQISHWIVENAKTARAYLNRINALYPLKQPLQSLRITELPRIMHKKGDHIQASGKDKNKTSEADFDVNSLLAPALQGFDVGLLSEAGMPAIADPGSSVVRAAHRLALGVVPLGGPVSMLMALAASGLSGQSFAFVGYIPQQEAQRHLHIKKLEQLARKTGQAQIVIETPYRNAALWQALLTTLRPDTWLSISAGLSLPNAISRSQSVQQWRSHYQHCPADKNTPAVFAFGC